MKKLLSVQCETLTNALKEIKPAVPKSSTLFILEHVVLSIGANCTVTATNQELTITSVFTPEGLHEQATILLPFKRTLDTLGVISGKEVIYLSEHPNHPYRYILQYGNNQVVLPSMAVSEFPELPELPNMVTEEIELTENQTTLLKKLTSCCSTEEYRPSMTGVCFNFNPNRNNQLDIVATDGYSLMKLETQHYNANPVQYIIPATAINAIAKKTARIQFTTSKLSATQAIIRSNGSQTILARNIDEKFPAYENVIPKEYTHHIKLNKAAISNALKCAAMFTNGTSNQVVLTASGNSTMVVQASDSESGAEATLEITAQCTTLDEPFAIGFNHKIFERMLQIPGEDFELQLITPTRAAGFRYNTTDCISGIAMPMRIDVTPPTIQENKAEVTVPEQEPTPSPVGEGGGEVANNLAVEIERAITLAAEDEAAFDITYSGDDCKELRRTIITEITGEQCSKSKATLSNLRNVCLARYQELLDADAAMEEAHAELEEIEL